MYEYICIHGCECLYLCTYEGMDICMAVCMCVCCMGYVHMNVGLTICVHACGDQRRLSQVLLCHCPPNLGQGFSLRRLDQRTVRRIQSWNYRSVQPCLALYISAGVCVGSALNHQATPTLVGYLDHHYSFSRVGIWMWKKSFELFPEIKINFRYLKDCILISCFLKNSQLPIILQYIKVYFDTQHIFSLNFSLLQFTLTPIEIL